MNEARTGFAWSLLLMLLGVIAAGLVFGWPHAAFTAVGFGAYFLYRQMQGADRLLNWVRQPFGTPPPVPTGNGVWDDVFAAMIRRTRKGVPVMSPDRWHFHHKLLRLGLGTRSVLAVAYAVCMALGAVAISVLFLPPAWHLALVLASWLGLLAFFTILHFIKERSLGDEERSEGK